jgi:enamine deaminase RidA (YjgF/YER057c/UK114 family)
MGTQPHLDSVSARVTLYPDTPYEYAAAAAGLVFTAGECPLDADGNVDPGGLEEQAHAAIENLFAVLAREGSSPEQILKTTVYVATGDRAELVCAWNVVEQRLAPNRPPSTLLGVSTLGWPGQLFEIEAIARA